MFQSYTTEINKVHTARMF